MAGEKSQVVAFRGIYKQLANFIFYHLQNLGVIWLILKHALFIPKKSAKIYINIYQLVINSQEKIAPNLLCNLFYFMKSFTYIIITLILQDQQNLLFNLYHHDLL